MLPGRSTIWCLIRSSQSFRFILCFWLSPPGQTEPERVQSAVVWCLVRSWLGLKLINIYLEKLLWSEDGRVTCFTVSGRSSSIQGIITILLSLTITSTVFSPSHCLPLTSHIPALAIICTIFIASSC